MDPITTAATTEADRYLNLRCVTYPTLPQPRFADQGRRSPQCDYRPWLRSAPRLIIEAVYRDGHSGPTTGPRGAP